ncbi:alpha/beta fold hydrolase [Fusibacter bizertensis]
MKFKRLIIVLTLIIAMLAMTACSDKATDSTTTSETISETTQENTQETTVKREIDFDAEGIATQFVDKFTAGSYDAVLADFTFSDEMKGQFTKSVMEEFSKQLAKTYGDFESASGIESNEKNGYYIVSIGGRHANKDLVYNVVFSYDGKISGFNYQEIPSIESYFGSEIQGASEKEVTFGEEAFKITGTLSMPTQGKGPFPVVVLVHGSGPNDRNESIYGNKPFKDIAEGLIKQGVAVLRYDKRTFTYLEKLSDPALVADFTIYDEVIDDAKYAVEFLKSQEGIDAKNIFVLGHSLGGNQVPRIAEGNADVAGIVVLAGNVTPLQQLILKQYEYLLGLDGSISESDQKQLDSIKAAADLISSDKMTLDTDMNDTLGLAPKYWMDIRDYNPITVASSLNKPILVLQGARDYQVTESEFELWKSGLGDKATYKLYDDLNHLFMTGEGMSTPNEYSSAGNVSQNVIEDIGAWIKANLK